VVTETFRSFVLQLYQNFPKQCSYAYVFRCSDQNDLIFLVISKTFQSMTEKKVRTIPPDLVHLVCMKWIT